MVTTKPKAADYMILKALDGPIKDASGMLKNHPSLALSLPSLPRLMSFRSRSSKLEPTPHQKPKQKSEPETKQESKEKFFTVAQSLVWLANCFGT